MSTTLFLLLLVVLRPLISLNDHNSMKNVNLKYNTQVVYTMKEMNEVGAGLQDIIPKKEGLDVGF